MRIILFFDLPTKTAKNKKDYLHFRKYLLNDGYDMLQWSVYSRICNNHEMVQKRLTQVKKNLPAKGSVRALPVTEKQYANMKILLGEKTTNEEFLEVNQLTLF
ncbi:CRISPR-associated endonuclease Cas2 [Salsuginibacillus kocurii]|uniref:CRISPR-associated endonuclease Cas2 n=1 Tax=Salsuginibacillus kocurii TaxID=427078 RepID=UPI000360B4E0|nr:CRISPR-associated endonuclease Cas2 [Salsuginibacillus kocurii]